MSQPVASFTEIHAAWIQGAEVAVIDLREEDAHAQGHPLFAANIPLSKLELSVLQKIPRLDTPVVLFDGGEGLIARGRQKLLEIGYSDIRLLAGDLAGWVQAGGELFRDVNSPSKAFGELVAEVRHTPLMPAAQLQERLDEGVATVVLDARRYDEYHTMSIPTGISVPGAELVRQAQVLAQDPATQIVVNCAGRTRSIIGAQSLINAGVPNPVAALRNGTIGWTLAGQTLEHGQTRQAGQAPVPDAALHARVHALALRAGVRFLPPGEVSALVAERARTTYCLDVRGPEEYAAGTLPGFQSAPGGQLVQETDFVAAVRGARIILADDDGIRARMTGSWLRQMNWEVWVVDGLTPADFSTPADSPKRPSPPACIRVQAHELASWLTEGNTLVLDVTASANHVREHIPGARWVLRRDILPLLPTLPVHDRVVLTCGSSLLAGYAAGDILHAWTRPVYVLDGGNQAWKAAGLPMESGDEGLLSPRIDRYRRPYEGTDNPVAAMQAYLDWEYGLVAQLARDASHGFFVI